MFRYRVIDWITTGNSLRKYIILDMETNETFEAYGKFFKEQGDDAFINVRVRNTFNILRKDKEIESYYTTVNGKRVKAYREKVTVKEPKRVNFVNRPMT